MFLIQDGREHFYQWDTARKLIVEDSSITEVHFCNKTEECSLVVKTYVEEGRTVADVPNILLQTDWRINVYAFDKNYTKHCAVFKVMARSKPDTYVYTETELLNYADLNEKITQMEQDIGQVVEDYLKENPIEMPDVDLSSYYTKAETDEAIAEAVGAIDIPEVEVDLSDYYNKDDIDAALAEKANKKDIPSIEGLATEAYVDSAIANIEIPEGTAAVNEVYIGTTEPTDANVEIWLNPEEEGAEYALKSDIPDTSVYALKSELPDVSAYQTEAQVNALINAALGVIENGTY